MVLSDTLSKLPNLANNQVLDLDDVDIISMDEIDQVQLDLLNFSPDKQKHIPEETSKDDARHALAQVIYTGWPDTIQELPPPPAPQEYWAYRNELAVESGVISKGKQVLIPKPPHANVLPQLHSGHQGIEKTRCLARESVYWPRSSKDIERLCTSCSLCQELQTSTAREPMQMHEKPTMPCLKVGTDLFEIDGNPFLIIADYFSHYPVVYQLTTTTMLDVIKATKETFAMLGAPREIVSDNGPQFLSKYNDFCKDWGMQHTSSSPRHHNLTDSSNTRFITSSQSLRNALSLIVTSAWLY